jgi:hypothetical protein
MKTNAKEPTVNQSYPRKNSDAMSQSSLMMRLATAHAEELRRVAAEQRLHRSAHARGRPAHRTVDPQTVVGRRRLFKRRFGLAQRVALRFAVRG